MIKDQGEVAIAIEHEPDGSNPVITGYALPSSFTGASTGKFEDNIQKRDVFLAGIDAFNVRLKYKNAKRHRKKKDPNKLLSAFIQGKLKYLEPEAETVMYQRAMMFIE